MNSQHPFLDHSDQLPYYLAFSMIPGIGMHTFSKLLAVFGTPENIYYQSSTHIEALIGKKKAESISLFKKRNIPHRIFLALNKKGVHIVPFSSLSQHKGASCISPIPMCLFVRGSLSFLTKPSQTIAIVGTRKPTSYGIKCARYFSQQLTQAGFTVISGMAVGIDSHAHQTCIDSGGNTIAVLGTGVLAEQTPQQVQQYTAILESGGTILSEFPPYSDAKPGHFVIRNRLIAGLADATLVIEGTIRSGSCITARNAAEQGKDVYCIPGQIDSDNAQCTNMLIKNGAHLVTSPEDITDHFSGQLGTMKL